MVHMLEFGVGVAVFRCETLQMASSGITMRPWFRSFLLFVIINGAIFTAVHRGVIGGDALHGFSRNGRYYVCYAGDCNAVSRSTFIYSYVHTVITVTSVPLVFLIPAAQALLGSRPKAGR